jgi:hypothetical protein
MGRQVPDPDQGLRLQSSDPEGIPKQQKPWFGSTFCEAILTPGCTVVHH